MTEVGIYEEDITYVRVSDFILLEQEQLSGDVEGADPSLIKNMRKKGYNVDGKTSYHSVCLSATWDR